jgi:hypothetical protein
MRELRLRPLLATVLAVTAAASAWSAGAAPARAFGKQSTADLQDQAIVIEAVPIPHFEKAQPQRTRFGRLEWRGGLVLKSGSKFFGGWSGLAIDPDGGRILAISDTGVWLTARMTFDVGRPVSLVDARLGALRAADGKPLARSRNQDAEGIALLQGTLTSGEVLISFERNHRVVRYPVSDAGVGTSADTLPAPPDTMQLPHNKSFEAVCFLQAGPAKGSVIVFAERFLKKDGSHTGWLRGPLKFDAANSVVSDRKWTTLSIQPIDGYDITDCAGAPDGSLLLLERRFRISYGDPLTGTKMRVRQISQSELMSGAVMTGETLIEADRQHDIDNMEGLAVHSDAAGRTILTLISDDNFNSYLQRTVLLQFALGEGPAAAVPTPSGERR